MFEGTKNYTKYKNNTKNASLVNYTGAAVVNVFNGLNRRQKNRD